MIWQDGVIYASAVAKGEINVCNDVRLACQRFLNQLENKEWEWIFDERFPQHVLNFAATLKHTKGPQAGDPIILEPFQILLICAVYGFRGKKDLTKRMVTDVILYIPRKAGKSTLTAVIALYELLCGDVGAEVFTLATNREQATIVFDASRGFIEYMPTELQDQFVVSKYEIKKFGDTQSMFKALSRDTKKTGDGKNPSCVIVDEAAQIVDRNAIEVLHSGMVKILLEFILRLLHLLKKLSFMKTFQCISLCLQARLQIILDGLDYYTD
jgi:phage terminase large subunit-like protein